MDKLEIIGGRTLQGSVEVSGSKNASLPILASCILTNKVVLKNVPLVTDIQTMLNLLSSIGSKIKINHQNKTIKIDNSKKHKTVAKYQLVKTMRAGVLVLGPLLAKYGKATVSLPGGCSIGPRPIDLHISALKKMGAKIKINNGYIHATAKYGLKGAKINFKKVSVGATENLIIAACMANGKTILNNCASEPEIKDLTNFLVKIGSKIRWINKRKIEIKGVKKLINANYPIMFDRIEAGTFMIAAAATRGSLAIKKIQPRIINKEIYILKKMGVKIIEKKK